MTSYSPKSFRAILQSAGTNLHWVVVRVPVDLNKAWPGWKNRRVCGQINGFAFRTTLFPGPKGQGHTLLVNKRMQVGAKTRAGEGVRVVLEPDLEERTAEVPKELTASLNGDRRLRRWFERLSPSIRKGISQFVDQARSVQTRRSRAEKMAESLMLAMEGEIEVPPILRAAFQRQPLAQAGWSAMTPTRRRNHLLGIFFVQTVGGREHRAAKAVEDALRVARGRENAGE